MKKGSASLYEVFKSATRAVGEATPPPATNAAPAGTDDSMTLQHRLAAYKAAKLAMLGAPASETPVEAAAPAPAPPAPVEPPQIEAPAPSEAPATAGPGERVLRVTYNTALFAGLLGIALIFIAYAIGVHSGRVSAAKEGPAEPVAVAPPPPAAPKTYTIQLAEWRAGTTKERLQAEHEVHELSQAMAKAKLGPPQAVPVKRGDEARLALYVGKFADPASKEARAALEAIQKFQFRKQTPFSGARFAEMAGPSGR